ncbi:hypothetical protein Leryth_009801 [Lithospermum erythrorhizon]|nr:hypothetical protein Leryth_009801 [Lithospermum erythrorhizon]
MQSLNISSHNDLESGQNSVEGGGDCISSSLKGGSCSSSDGHVSRNLLSIKNENSKTFKEEVDHSGPEIVGVPEKERVSSVSDCSVEIDLEDGEEKEVKSHLERVERDCRICHLTLDAWNQESGFPIELGCSCKDDLAAAHKQCAEAWFKIKGNRTCEICGSVARNVSGPNETALSEQWDDENAAAVTTSIPGPPGEARRYFWQGHRFLNFLLACMVFAFVISWLFHFNVPS